MLACVAGHSITVLASAGGSRPVYVSLPTTDLLRARYCYATTLGLPIVAVGGPEPGNPDLRGRVVYRAGAGTMLSLYERPPSRAEHAAAFFVVDDFDQTIAGLRTRGLALQDYDLPHIKTQDGVLVGPGSTTPTPTYSAWLSTVPHQPGGRRVRRSAGGHLDQRRRRQLQARKPQKCR